MKTRILIGFGVTTLGLLIVGLMGWFGFGGRNDPGTAHAAAAEPEQRHPSDPGSATRAPIDITRVEPIDEAGGVASPAAPHPVGERPILSAEQQSIVIANVRESLEEKIRVLRPHLAEPRPLATLGELLTDYQRRIDLRRAEAFLPKLQQGDLEYIWFESGVPRSAAGKLFEIRGGFSFGDQRAINAMLTIGPGEDQELDGLVRAGHETALAYAEELAGGFNNLPLEERARRAQRIVALRGVHRSAAVAAELTELGVHEYLDLIPERFEMAVVGWVRNWSWGGR